MIVQPQSSHVHAINDRPRSLDANAAALRNLRMYKDALGRNILSGEEEKAARAALRAFQSGNSHSLDGQARSIDKEALRLAKEAAKAAGKASARGQAGQSMHAFAEISSYAKAYILQRSSQSPYAELASEEMLSLPWCMSYAIAFGEITAFVVDASAQAGFSLGAQRLADLMGPLLTEACALNSAALGAEKDTQIRGSFGPTILVRAFDLLARAGLRCKLSDAAAEVANIYFARYGQKLGAPPGTVAKVNSDVPLGEEAPSHDGVNFGLILAGGGVAAKLAGLF